MTKPIRPTISPQSIDKLVAAGATVEVVAKIGKRHLPELAPDIDVLVDCAAPTVAGFVKAELQARHDKADGYAAGHAAHMRQIRSGQKNQGEGKPQRRHPPKRVAEPESPLDGSGVSQVSQVSQVSRGLTSAHEAHPPAPPPGPSSPLPPNSDPDGSAAIRAALNPDAQIVVLNESPKAKLYRVGHELLLTFGKSEREARTLIGRWLKTEPDPAGLLAAIQFARDQNVADPIAYISTLISTNGAPSEVGVINARATGII